MGIYHQSRLLLLDPRDRNIVRERKERRGGLTCYSRSPSLRLYVPCLLLGVRSPLHGGIGIRPLLISMSPQSEKGMKMNQAGGNGKVEEVKRG
jgi:hypothetical protein